MSGRVRNPQIYVKGYGKSVTREDLKGWFKKYGKIICIQYKGPYSFIQFEDYYDAQSAAQEMNDKKIQGYRLIVQPSGKKRYPATRNRSRSEHRRHQRNRPRLRSSSSSPSESSSSRGSSSSSSSRSSSSVSHHNSHNSDRRTKSKAKRDSFK